MFRSVELVEQSRRRFVRTWGPCNDVHWEKWRAVWFSHNFPVLQASAETQSVLSRVECCT